MDLGVLIILPIIGILFYIIVCPLEQVRRVSTIDVSRFDPERDMSIPSSLPKESDQGSISSGFSQL